MFRRFLCGALLATFALIGTASSAMAATEPEPGYTRADPFPSPHGLVLRGSHGYQVIVGALPAGQGTGAEAGLAMNGSSGEVHYIVPADLSDEDIHANFGRYGRVDLRWVPSGETREVRTNCEGFIVRSFFATGKYVGAVRVRGGGGFTRATAHRIQWRRSWYPTYWGCPIRISEGMPGPGKILEAGGTADFWDPVHLDAIQNHSDARVEYQVVKYEHAGRMYVTRYAFALGGPKTIRVDPGFRTGEISPPAPFSGVGRFERTKGAHGTWRGDLSVEFLDHTHLRLAGRSFEAIFHSGYHEQHRRLR